MGFVDRLRKKTRRQQGQPMQSMWLAAQSVGTDANLFWNLTAIVKTNYMKELSVRSFL